MPEHIALGILTPELLLKGAYEYAHINHEHDFTEIKAIKPRLKFLFSYLFSYWKSIE